MTTSLLYVCLDGLGDDPIPAFDGRTPLEAADTPNLDALATRGRTRVWGGIRNWGLRVFGLRPA